MTDKILTQDRLKELLSYDPETGVFTHKTYRGGRIKAGERAGALMNKGYVHIKVDGKKYLAHRLVWLYVSGQFPTDEVDHINGDRADNRLVNLRAVTKKQNCENRKQQINNKSGHRGVHWHKASGKWQAMIRHQGELIPLGLFNDVIDAANAARFARDMLFTHHKTEYAA